MAGLFAIFRASTIAPGQNVTNPPSQQAIKPNMAKAKGNKPKTKHKPLPSRVDVTQA